MKQREVGTATAGGVLTKNQIAYSFSFTEQKLLAPMKPPAESPFEKAKPNKNQTIPPKQVSTRFFIMILPATPRCWVTTGPGRTAGE